MRMIELKMSLPVDAKRAIAHITDVPRTAALSKPRKLPTQARAQQTVETILAATKKLLVRHGYEGTSTNRVAEVAGVSIGSLYQYFPSKAALVNALVQRHLARMSEVLASTAAAQGEIATVEQATRTVIRAIFAAHRVNPSLHRVLLEQMPRIGEIDNLAVFEAQTQQLIEAYLIEHASEVRRENIKMASRVAILAVRGVTLWTVMRNPKDLEDEAFLEEVTDMALRYLVKD